MNLTEYRSSPNEKARIGDLMCMLPHGGGRALDIGARDGFISRLLADHFAVVVALDLETPIIEHEKIQCLRGDITSLDFDNSSFDLVFCAEVLEHIPPHLLKTACKELARVSKKNIIIGVPYKQDIRLGRTTCSSCGMANPPWGHVNRFDEKILVQLFPEFSVAKKSFVGETDAQTNAISCMLMDMAGNPYGTYSQEESCVHCGENIGGPSKRKLWQKVLTKAAFFAMSLQKPFLHSHANWIHVLLEKRA